MQFSEAIYTASTVMILFCEHNRTQLKSTNKKTTTCARYLVGGFAHMQFNCIRIREAGPAQSERRMGHVWTGACARSTPMTGECTGERPSLNTVSASMRSARIVCMCMSAVHCICMRLCSACTVHKLPSAHVRVCVSKCVRIFTVQTQAHERYVCVCVCVCTIVWECFVWTAVRLSSHMFIERARFRSECFYHLLSHDPLVFTLIQFN